MIIPKEKLRVVLDGLMANTLPKLEKSLSEKLLEGFYSYFPDYEVITAKRIAAFDETWRAQSAKSRSPR